MAQIKFQDIKSDLQSALSSKTIFGVFPNEPGGFTLVDGFINQPIQSELSGNIVIGGPAIPMVAIVGNTTGRMYFFALKALLPHLEI